MSGGVAYIYDPDGVFPAKCNMELVDLVSPGLADPEDEEIVHGLIEEHRDRTGSMAAAELMSDWFNTKKAFVKVYPRDYKRVLEVWLGERRSPQPYCSLIIVHQCTRTHSPRPRPWTVRFRF
jgi:glutamate synthase domain-containing protein 3